MTVKKIEGYLKIFLPTGLLMVRIALTPVSKCIPHHHTYHLAAIRQMSAKC